MVYGRGLVLYGMAWWCMGGGLPEGPVESSPDPDSFSDSYTHISSSSSHEPPIPELLGGLELTEEDEDADRPGSEGVGSEQGPSQPGESVAGPSQPGEAVAGP